MKGLCIILLFVATIACKKAHKSDMCEDVIGGLPPTEIGLVFIDSNTGENILLAKNIDPATIIVTQESTKLTESSRFAKDTASPFYGILLIHLADSPKGVFRYNVRVPDVTTTTVSYTNVEKENGVPNACHSTYLQATDPTIVGQSYTVTKINSRTVITISL